MTGVILSRARDVAEKFPFPRAPKAERDDFVHRGHGTGNMKFAQAIERQVELIRARNIYAAVHPVFMEEAPRIGDCYPLAATRNLVMVPFFHQRPACIPSRTSPRCWVSRKRWLPND